MDDARLFLCARCQRQVLICSRYDRGQQYCGTLCSGLARGESLRGAGRRYQQSRRGRHCHAERQRRYRRRCREGACREKVTHQGSVSLRCGAPLARHRVARREASPSMSPQPATTMHCHFCARPVREFDRLRWRRSPVRRRTRSPHRGRSPDGPHPGRPALPRSRHPRDRRHQRPPRTAARCGRRATPSRPSLTLSRLRPPARRGHAASHLLPSGLPPA